jgi:hypothetical protein
LKTVFARPGIEPTRWSDLPESFWSASGNYANFEK